MMKKIIKYLIPAALAVVTALSCADHRSDNMEEFQTMVYFRNGGEQTITLFRTGENGSYEIPVCKSGRNLEGVTSAIVMPFTETQLAIYNTKNETDYALIPTSCFKFTDKAGKALADQSKVLLDFSSTDTYQVVYLDINTVAISALQEADPDHDYVLGVQLFSPDQVSDQINLLLLKPAIDIPVVSFISSGEEKYTYTTSSESKNVYKNSVSLNIDKNKWDFNCGISVNDQAWLDDYNLKNGKSYTLLPAEAYALSTSEVAFAKGDLEVPFSITIDRTYLSPLTEFALPITLSSCSKAEFSIDGKKKDYILNVRLDPDQITVTADMISVSSQQSGDGGGAAALIDDDTSTYWHTVYSTHNGDPVYGEYVDIALKTPLKAIVFKYCTRATNTNGIPVCVGVFTKATATSDWVQLGQDIENDEMASAVAAQWITLPVLQSETSFSFVRFAVLKANPSQSGDLRIQGTTNFTSLSELQLFGTN